MLQAAVQAMRLCRARAAFAAWQDFVAARQQLRGKLASAVHMFANRSCVLALQSWKVRAAAWTSWLSGGPVNRALEPVA